MDDGDTQDRGGDAEEEREAGADPEEVGELVVVLDEPAGTGARGASATRGRFRARSKSVGNLGIDVVAAIARQKERATTDVQYCREFSSSALSLSDVSGTRAPRRFVWYENGVRKDDEEPMMRTSTSCLMDTRSCESATRLKIGYRRMTTA